jgi:hypothetical protein
MSPLSKSLQIQQQLELLRHQQEALMNRFGNLHTNTPPDRSKPVHRRGQSAQVGGGQSNASNAFGAMGRFGLDGASAFNQGIVGNNNLQTPWPMETWQTQKVTAVVTVFK